MSLKVLHLTTGRKAEPIKVALAASAIVMVQDSIWWKHNADYDHWKTLIVIGPGEDGTMWVSEPYDQVLRMWADALSD